MRECRLCRLTGIKCRPQSRRRQAAAEAWEPSVTDGLGRFRSLSLSPQERSFSSFSGLFSAPRPAVADLHAYSLRYPSSFFSLSLSTIQEACIGLLKFLLLFFFGSVEPLSLAKRRSKCFYRANARLVLAIRSLVTLDYAKSPSYLGIGIGIYMAGIANDFFQSEM